MGYKSNLRIIIVDVCLTEGLSSVKLLCANHVTKLGCKLSWAVNNLSCLLIKK